MHDSCVLLTPMRKRRLCALIASDDFRRPTVLQEILMNIIKFVLSFACLLLYVAGASAGPVGMYYLTAGDQGTNWVVQGTTVVTSGTQAHTANLGEYAIALTGGTVRTLGN